MEQPRQINTKAPHLFLCQKKRPLEKKLAIKFYFPAERGTTIHCGDTKESGAIRVELAVADWKNIELFLPVSGDASVSKPGRDADMLHPPQVQIFEPPPLCVTNIGGFLHIVSKTFHMTWRSPFNPRQKVFDPLKGLGRMKNFTLTEGGVEK